MVDEESIFIELNKNEKDDFKYIGDYIKYDMLPINNQKIDYEKLEEKVYTFFDGEEDDLNLSTNLNLKNSNLNKTNENPNQNNQILNNNNENFNLINIENKENPFELKCDKKNNSLISEVNKIEPYFYRNQSAYGDAKNIQNVTRGKKMLCSNILHPFFNTNQYLDLNNINKKKLIKRIIKNSGRRKDVKYKNNK